VAWTFLWILKFFLWYFLWSYQNCLHFERLFWKKHFFENFGDFNDRNYFCFNNFGYFLKLLAFSQKTPVNNLAKTDLIEQKQGEYRIEFYWKKSIIFNRNGIGEQKLGQISKRPSIWQLDIKFSLRREQWFGAIDWGAKKFHRINGWGREVFLLPKVTWFYKLEASKPINATWRLFEPRKKRKKFLKLWVIEPLKKVTRQDSTNSRLQNVEAVWATKKNKLWAFEPSKKWQDSTNSRLQNPSTWKLFEPR